MHVVVFTGGMVRRSRAVEAAIARARLIVAADGGAETALRLGYLPGVVVGDLDSLDIHLANSLKERGCRFVEAPQEKNETDTELALRYALEQGASEITLLGALGGPRYDHMLANVLLLVACDSVPLRIIDGPETCWLLRGPGRSIVRGHRDDLLSLLPLSSEAAGIRTTNLYYPLNNEALRLGSPRGMSNVFTHDEAEVWLESGLLLLIHTRMNEPG